MERATPPPRGEEARIDRLPLGAGVVRCPLGDDADPVDAAGAGLHHALLGIVVSFQVTLPKQSLTK